MPRIEEYLREDGSSPYQVWFDRIPAQAAAKVANRNSSGRCRQYEFDQVVFRAL